MVPGIISCRQDIRFALAYTVSLSARDATRHALPAIHYRPAPHTGALSIACCRAPCPASTILLFRPPVVSTQRDQAARGMFRRKKLAVPPADAVTTRPRPFRG